MFFSISKCRGVRITCTVWDDHVAKIEPFYNTSTEEPLVVLIQFCRARACLNSKCITLYSFFLAVEYILIICLLYKKDRANLPLNAENYSFVPVKPAITIKYSVTINNLFPGGEIKICSSYDVTQLLFNQETPEFLVFKERFVFNTHYILNFKLHISFWLPLKYCFHFQFKLWADTYEKHCVTIQL